MKFYKASICNTRIQGFTLIEIMVALVIVGILVAISFPIFQRHQLKATRTQAVSWLSHLRLEMERCGSNNNGSYTGCDGAGAALPLALVNPVLAQKYSDLHYTVAITINTINGQPGAGYTLTATESTGVDTDCTSLTIDNFGNKESSGARTNNIRCWGSN